MNFNWKITLPIGAIATIPLFVWITNSLVDNKILNTPNNFIWICIIWVAFTLGKYFGEMIWSNGN